MIRSVTHLALALLAVNSAAIAAPASEASRFDPVETFAPLTLPDPVNSYRSANGAPGPAYWQNRADYVLRARLLPATHELRATEIITYTNNSPDRLDALWLQVDQNAYRKDSRSHLAIPRHRPPPKSGEAAPPEPYTEGFEFDSVQVEQAGKTQNAAYLVSDTRMQIRLAQPLLPHGKLRLHIRYHYTVPGLLGGRTAWGPSKNGDIYDIAQWYPRMAVYDDVRGWDTLPYLASEFYLEYGNFDYAVTVPADMVVAGTGELVNANEVLTATQRARLAQARTSDATVVIRSADEVGHLDPHARAGERTWHFRMNDTRDVAFAASAAFVWDAARINLPNHKSALAMSFYPVEAMAPDGWQSSTAYVKDAIQNFSARWAPFPWPTAINVAGPASGMEYPGMAFDGVKLRGKVLFWVSAHELGHSWFPMMVGFNERRDAWMDEGFNTFIDVIESDDYDHGIFGPKRDSEYAPGGGNPVEEIQKVLQDPKAPSLLTYADVTDEPYRHPVTYFKSALGLVLLRNEILGKDRFDFAFRKFIRDWSFKHPTPSDFFRAMDSAGGEDLSWFWRGWYFHNWNVDLAVEKVTYDAGGPSHGAKITIANLDRLVMPATVEITFADRSKRDIELPADTWVRQRSLELPVDSTQPITSVEVDPEKRIPDANRANNVLKGPFETAPTGK